ncbi:MAG: ATP-binding protein, partial [Candidatus Eremiobacterota bacterium]
LVSNAVKFTPAGCVLLELGPLGEGRGPGVEVRVRDSGIGIAEEHLPHLFQPFFQVDASATRQHAGTGLGLAISQRLAGLMGGSIQVESQPGRGSVFTLALPLETVEEAAPVPDTRRILALGLPRETDRSLRSRAAREGWEVVAEGAAADLALLGDPSRAVPDGMPRFLVTRSPAELPPGFAGVVKQPLSTATLRRAVMGQQVSSAALHPVGPAIRVLLVEDNPVNRHVTRRMLARLGFDAELAGNGVEALDALRRTFYPLVLMDLHMPVMDGLQAIREIRTGFPVERQPKILALTANVLPEDREAMLTAGADGFLGKPMRLDDLREALTGLSLPLARRRE